MKSAKVHVAAVELICPTCEEHLSNATDYTHMFTEETISEIVGCDFCKVSVKVPKRAFALLGVKK